MDWNKTSLLLACVGALGTLPFAASAAPVTPSLFASAESFYWSSSSTPSLCNDSSAGATVTCRGSAATPQNNGATVHYDATATAAYGVLKAGASISTTGAPGASDRTYGNLTSAESDFKDAWTIGGGAGTGTLNLKFHVDGTYIVPTAGDLEAAFILTNYDDHGASDFANAELSSGFHRPSGTIDQDVTLSTTFTFGTPLSFRVLFGPEVALYDLGINDSVSYDLSDTATMEAIGVQDALGNVIPFTLSTSSGASLFTTLAASSGPSTSVPEPSSIALFGAGLLGLFWLSTGPARRRRRSDAA